jgi:hypothetical protein
VPWLAAGVAEAGFSTKDDIGTGVFEANTLLRIGKGFIESFFNGGSGFIG